MLVISAFKNLKVISKLMVNLILNCFENSVVDKKVGCDFSVYFFSGEETEAERKRYLHERFPHFMLFHSFFHFGSLAGRDQLNILTLFHKCKLALQLVL